MIDNFELITSNVTYLSYYLLELLGKQYSPREIFAFAVRMDADAYVEEGSLDTYEIFENVLFSFEEQCLTCNDCYYADLHLFDDNRISTVDAFTFVSMVTMCLLLTVDNPEMDFDDIYSSVLSKTYDIHNIVSTILEKDIFNDSDSDQKERIKTFIRESDEWETWKSDMDDLIDSYGECSVVIYDLDKYLSRGKCKKRSGYDEKSLLPFLEEVDGILDHKKEHNDFIDSLNSGRGQFKEVILDQYPSLTKAKIERMYNSSDEDDLFVAGLCFFHGVLAKTDFEKAYTCFLISARADNPDAAYYVSLMYLKSLHVSYDPKSWIKYLALSCRLGNQEAISQWKELVSNKKEYNSIKSQVNNKPRTTIANVVAKTKQTRQRRTPKAAIVFSILGGVCILYGVILIVMSNMLGLMPILIGAIFTIIAVVKFILG